MEIFLTTVENDELDRELKIGYTNDIGWGCCIRVAQMLLAHAILRHSLGSGYSMEEMIEEGATYQQILTLMNDNADGAQGSFSIQNIARMSLIYNKFPGEWHGPGSISNVLRDLNKLYNPYENF